MPLFKTKGVKFNPRRPKLRSNWKLWNLYQLAKYRPPQTAHRTFYQQKWDAKSATRAYHGEYVLEKKWSRTFSKQSAAVVPMIPYQLAKSDGSEFSAGRGSGREAPPSAGGRRKQAPIPYMQMVFHPLERRLDTAVFRALFASSTGQARQMVIHGHVKVNGKKMQYPGYQLNPGDMFQVEVEEVLRATGCPKNYLNNQNNSLDENVGGRARANAIRSNQAWPPPAKSGAQARSPAAAVSQKESDEASTSRAQETPEEELDEEAEEKEDDDGDGEADLIAAEGESGDNDAAQATKSILLGLRTRAKDLLSNPPASAKLSSTQKQQARDLSKRIRASLSRAASVTTEQVQAYETETQTLHDQIVAGAKDTSASGSSPGQDGQGGQTGSSGRSAYAIRKAAKDDAFAAALAERLALANDNPRDPSKPYLTPWQPRDYMSAFAFIPRYLEVNQNICSAVYLRHPVCKPGYAEVPTPFPLTLNQAAFNWYLRRR